MLEDYWGLDSIASIREVMTMVSNLATVTGFLTLLFNMCLNFISNHSRLFGVVFFLINVFLLYWHNHDYFVDVFCCQSQYVHPDRTPGKDSNDEYCPLPLCR